MTMTSDGELVLQARAGRREAYEDLVRRWAPRVLAFCHARVARADAAEDLAQETLFRGWARLSTLSEPEKFGSWLQGIALRASLDWLKSRARKQVPFSVLQGASSDIEELLPSREESGEGSIEAAEDRGELLREVEALPEEHRIVLLLYYYEDVTYQDIAAMLGVSAATVNARLTKARATLRRRLSRSKRCPG